MTRQEMLAICAGAKKTNSGYPALNPRKVQQPLDPNATTVFPIIGGLAIVHCILVGIAMMTRIFIRANLIKICAFPDIMMMHSVIGFAVLVGLTLS